MTNLFDVVVVGGGPAGATAAHQLALQGKKYFYSIALVVLSLVAERFHHD
jgi:flavin-dependent dehydrogenase